MRKLLLLLILIASPGVAEEIMSAAVGLRRPLTPEAMVAAGVAWEAKGATPMYLLETGEQGLYMLRRGREPQDMRAFADAYVKRRARVKKGPATVWAVQVDGLLWDLKALELDPLVETVDVIGPAEKLMPPDRGDPVPAPMIIRGVTQND